LTSTLPVELSHAAVIDPPCALGGPVGRARVRASAEDFVVREWLGFEADGEGEHWLLRVRKRAANTHWVVKQLARLAKIHPRDIGFAGVKDRNAVAEQAFTVPVRSAVGAAWEGVAGEGFEVIGAQRHRRKLKRGALRGNEFEIVLREFSDDPQLLQQRLQALAIRGAPNYFGPQRFGIGGNNLTVASDWFSGGAAPFDRVQRGFALSAARAAIFNAVLAERVEDGSWETLLPGDIVNLDGSGSIFAAEAVDDVLRERASRLDIHPTGPMWGKTANYAAFVSGERTFADGTERSSVNVSEVVPARERAVADRFPTFTAGLAGVGVEAARRALRMRVGDLRWTIEGDVVRLHFRLPSGSFATALLRELVVSDADSGEGGDDG
jgi:tRNA pseudouridine13 synthase